jgi:predicted dehydrogenase
LVGIADVNVERVSAEHPKARVFADYRQLLDEARPDAVIIASPNQLHAETGIECARRSDVSLPRQLENIERSIIEDAL